MDGRAVVDLAEDAGEVPWAVGVPGVFGREAGVPVGPDEGGERGEDARPEVGGAGGGGEVGVQGLQARGGVEVALFFCVDRSAFGSGSRYQNAGEKGERGIVSKLD